MEVQFSPEQEARISQIADFNGISAEHLVRQAVLRVLKEDVAFRAGVRLGIEQADRGEFIEHDEVRMRVENLLRGFKAI